MQMKLFHAPGSCSLGIRVLLNEAEAPHQVVTVDLARGDQQAPDFRAVNPKGKVPALVRDDGSVLTEFPAIALWLARKYPGAGLWPADPEGEVRTLELLEFLVSTVHMRGFTLALVPQKFTPDPAAQAGLRAHGLQVARSGLLLAESRLDAGPFLNGARPGVTDAALFYLLNWAPRIGIELPPALQRFDERMRMRSSVRKALDLPAA